MLQSWRKGEEKSVVGHLGASTLSCLCTLLLPLHFPTGRNTFGDCSILGWESKTWMGVYDKDGSLGPTCLLLQTTTAASVLGLESSLLRLLFLFDRLLSLFQARGSCRS